jgi:hypothetical protein
MVIERIAGELVIRFPITSDIEQIQDIIDYLRYKELTDFVNDLNAFLKRYADTSAQRRGKKGTKTYNIK